MSLLHHVFKSDYEIVFSAWGDGILNENSLPKVDRPDAVFSEFRSKHYRDPRAVSLRIEDSTSCGYCITSIDPGFLVKFERLKELVLHDSFTGLEMTPELEKLFRKNRTLIRGAFDSFAERFARENGLRFRPADFVFATLNRPETKDVVKMTVIFSRNGKVFARENVSSPGSSPGLTSGIFVDYPLKKDFYNSTIEDIVSEFNLRVREEVIKDGRLAVFMEKAKTHDYYKGRN